MKRFFLLSQWAFLAAPLLADSGLLRVSEVRRVDYHFNRATGELRRSAGPALRAAVCWDSTQWSGYFVSFSPREVTLDWGDADNATCLSAVTGFQIGYAAKDLPDDQTEIDILFYASDNGFGEMNRELVAALRLTGLPDGTSPGVAMGWIANFTVTPPIDLTSDDLDHDDQGDFSYTYNMHNAPADGLAGPLLSADPNTALSMGAENAFDLYSQYPDVLIEPNDFLIPDVNAQYDGTFWFGGGPYAQWHMQLSAGDPNAPGCGHPDCDAADIEPSGGGDCDVDLSDLAVLLAHFGATSGATRDDGDVEGADGDVDLADLATMLGAYGAHCQAPGRSCVYTVTDITHVGGGADNVPPWIALGATCAGEPCALGADCRPQVRHVYGRHTPNRTCVTFSNPVCEQAPIGPLCPLNNTASCP
jgi:hypothetical protein